MSCKIDIKNLNVTFGKEEALKEVSFSIETNEILSIIGPANSGKSTLLCVLNRMIDRIPDHVIKGKVLLDQHDIMEIADVEELRRRIGVVYATPIPLPMSIEENILFGPRLQKKIPAKKGKVVVEETLRAVYLWDEVKDRLHSSGLALSGGQQQRLCLARTLALDPEVILLDEPCSGLDPISTAKVEEALKELKKKRTIVLVTNNTKQAARVGDRTAFLLMGELIEIDRTSTIFTSPRQKKTEDYVTGKFG
jgi:phosphate transport system ATP-binding protein